MASPYQYIVPSGPKEDMVYPMKIVYCGECGLPSEFCEYSPNVDKCRVWLEKALPDEFAKLNAVQAPPGATEGGGGNDAGTGDAGDDGKKGASRQTRGGKAQPKKKKEVEHHIAISRASRGKKKYVTTITGLSTYGIDLKVASKFFGQRFATGSSVTGNNDEIVIQGDVKDELFDVLVEKWPEIDEDSIDDLGDVKR